MHRRLFIGILLFSFIFLYGCKSVPVTGEFIRDTLDTEVLSSVELDSGTVIDFGKETIGFFKFNVDCERVMVAKDQFTTLWNKQEEDRVAIIKAREKGEVVEEEICGSSSEYYSSVTLISGDNQAVLEDCSGKLKNIVDDAETSLDVCLKKAVALAKDTDEIAFRYCTESTECRIVPSISGLNRFPGSDEQGCLCHATINGRYRDVWFKMRRLDDQGRLDSCGPCEPEPIGTTCMKEVCVPVS